LYRFFKAGYLFIYKYSLHFSSRESGLGVETWHCYMGDPKQAVTGKKIPIHTYTHTQGTPFLPTAKIIRMQAPQVKECISPSGNYMA